MSNLQQNIDELKDFDARCWYIRRQSGLRGPLSFTDFIGEIWSNYQNEPLAVFRSGWGDWCQLSSQLYQQLYKCWQLHRMISEWPGQTEVPSLPPKVSLSTILTDGGNLCLGQVNTVNEGLVIVDNCEITFRNGPITIIVRDPAHELAFRDQAVVVRTFLLGGSWEVWLRLKNEDKWLRWLQEVSEKEQLKIADQTPIFE